MAKDAVRAAPPPPLPFPECLHWCGLLRGLCPPSLPLLPLVLRGLCPPSLPLLPLVLLSLLSSSVSGSGLPGVEYDWSQYPRLVCTPIPVDADPSCFALGGAAHGPSSNGQSAGQTNGHHTPSGGLPSSSEQGAMSDEAKSTILHLRESLVRQKETILDQRETIRELTAKLTLCEGFGRVHRDDRDDHHGTGHGSGHHGPGNRGSGHHYDNHDTDPHFPLNGHRSDPHHRGKAPYLGQHGGFSAEQTGKTLQMLKERLESLLARNSSSSYSSSLRDLLQRKISALEEQLHHYHDGHHDYGRHDNHHGPSHHDDAHHDDHHDTQRYNHYGHRYDRHNSHRNDHHDDHLDDDHHDESHHRSVAAYKPGPRVTARSGVHNKLDTVISHLHHRNTDPGPRKKSKNPDAFQVGFPMRTDYMYGRVKHTLLNEIFALTVCLWIKGRSGPGLGTPFSYSVPGQANELVLIEWGNNPMELLINDKAVTLPMTLADSKWHHLCATWSTRDGAWEAYQDGVKRGSGENLSPWHPIKPGGVFILGQEQDSLGGRFDTTQSFVGELSDLQLWSRVLTPSEIHGQATCGSHLAGDIITWTEAVVELHGGVSKYPFDPCH